MESVPWCDSEQEEAGSVYKVQKVGVANRDQRRRGGGGQSSAIGCLLWPVSMPVCLRGGSRMLRRQRQSGAGRRGRDTGVTSPALDGHSVLRGGS